MKRSSTKHNGPRGFYIQSPQGTSKSTHKYQLEYDSITWQPTRYHNLLFLVTRQFTQITILCFSRTFSHIVLFFLSTCSHHLSLILNTYYWLVAHNPFASSSSLLCQIRLWWYLFSIFTNPLRISLFKGHITWILQQPTTLGRECFSFKVCT